MMNLNKDTTKKLMITTFLSCLLLETTFAIDVEQCKQDIEKRLSITRKDVISHIFKNIKISFIFEKHVKDYFNELSNYIQPKNIMLTKKDFCDKFVKDNGKGLVDWLKSNFNCTTPVTKEEETTHYKQDIQTCKASLIIFNGETPKEILKDMFLNHRLDELSYSRSNYSTYTKYPKEFMTVMSQNYDFTGTARYRKSSKFH